MRRSVPIASPNCRGATLQKSSGSRRRRLEVDHQIVLGDQVDPAAAPRDADQFGEGALCMWNRLQHMTADDQIERRVGQSQLEDAPVLEAHAFPRDGASRAGQSQVIIDHVDAEQTGAGKHLSEAQRNLAGAAARVEYVRLDGQAVAVEQWLFLRPDRLGLRREIADHRLVRHLPGLRVQVIRHAGVPRSALLTALSQRQGTSLAPGPFS